MDFRSRKTWTNLLFIVLAIGVFAWFYKKYRVAPDLTTEQISIRTPEGETVSLSQFSGKVILLNFWQTWCGPCLAEMGSIEKARQLTDSSKVVFITVTDENPAAIAAFRDSHPYRFHYFISEKKLSELGINAYPTTYLLDKSGKIVLTKIGAADWSAPAYLERIRELSD
ncbi:MAG TPA: TlpA disulfide reductase family protein [Bacteroidia bacterium]|nr:TlpA disulfide reductase family protein [Bacteroidia bacterium]